MLNIVEKITSELKVKKSQVEATIQLLDDGNTIPFISRYRKEATGTLDEEQIRQISIWLEKLRALEERRQTVLAVISGQEKLTPELEQKILEASTLTELEDLYQPYKPKRRTRASVAREKGLQDLADLILKQPITSKTLEDLAAPFLNEAVPSVEDAYAGARDIVAEVVSDHAEVRQSTRQRSMQFGVLKCEWVEDAVDERKVYQQYYAFESLVSRIRPYQVLAINRGEKEKVLRVTVDIAERDWQLAVGSNFRMDQRSILYPQLMAAIEDGVKRLLIPAIQRDVRSELTEKAEAHAIQVFADNLRGLLSQPPLTGYVVIGLDPGFRTGCKTAVVDATGKVLATDTIYPHEPQKKWTQAIEKINLLIDQYQASLISIGNGTASRETERLAAEITKNRPDVHYIITNEAGASVYSASSLARAEMPDLDVSLRGAVSIARRVQDPLAELVKIDPKSIGVGLYQHDVNQAALADALNAVVESVVNQVGVDVNTASPALLQYVAGIGPKIAERIVHYRDEHGAFKSRNEILEVNGLGKKAFEQAAGFLRIRGGDEPLDASAIHPESYPIARAVMQKAGIVSGATNEEKQSAVKKLMATTPVTVLAKELGCGSPTLTDIYEQLLRPGRDPREDLPAPILRSDVVSMEILTPGMRLNGTVRNVVDFGAFVDIGVKQDGLLHRSQIPKGTQLGVGDIIQVAILNVETDRGRISLTWAES